MRRNRKIKEPYLITLNIISCLRFVAIAGNSIFFLWMLVNGIKENFSGLGTVEFVSTIGIMSLLLFNVFLFLKSGRVE